MNAQLRKSQRRRARLHARLTQFCEFILRHGVIYWGLVLLFLALCLGPLLILAMTKEAPASSILWTLAAGLTGIPVLLGAVYMLRPVPPSPGWDFSRMVTSELAEANVVLVDTALITRGRRCVHHLTQPVAPAASLRQSPGALSLAAAMTYTAHFQQPEDEQALLEAADALGLRRANLLHYRPVETDTRLGNLPGVVVRDGKRRMAYFCGGAGDLCDMCGGILDGSVRALTDEDRAAIREAMLDLGHQGSRVLAFAFSDDTSDITAPIFLGLAGIQDEICEDAAHAAQTLLADGVTLITQPISDAFPPPLSLSALRSRLGTTEELYDPQVIISPDMLDTRAMSISPVDQRHQNFDAPVMLAREWFSHMEAWLRVSLCAALPLMLCCSVGSLHPLWCLAFLLQLAPALCTMDPRYRAGMGSLLLPFGACTLGWAFVLLTTPAHAAGAMALICAAAALTLSLHLCGRWQMTLLCIGFGLILLPLAWLLHGLPLMTGGFSVLTGILSGVLGGQLIRRSVHELL